MPRRVPDRPLHRMFPRHRGARALALAVLAATGLACGTALRRGGDGESRPAVVGYLAAWNTGPGGARILSLPGGDLTHVIYAFALISPEGEAVLGDPCLDVGRCATAADSARVGPGGNFGRLRELEQRHPGLKTLVAIGGWTGSARFSDAALTDASRTRFARSVVDRLIVPHAGLIDGIDVDWEYPTGGGLPTNVARPEDRENFTLLLRALRAALDEQGRRDGRRYLLTAATSAGPGVARGIDLPAVGALLDWFNVMTYDYHAGARVANFNAPLYAAPNDPTPELNVDATVRRYLAAGVPRDRIVLGLPFYGRGFSGIDSANAGLFQRVDSLAVRGTVPGDLDARTRVADRLGARGFQRHWSAEARVPWLYDPRTRVWVSFEDERSIAEKARYARAQRLRGVMAWELLGDDGTFTRLMARTVRGR